MVSRMRVGDGRIFGEVEFPELIDGGVFGEVEFLEVVIFGRVREKAREDC